MSTKPLKYGAETSGFRITCPTKAEHDAIVARTGRPFTQEPIGHLTEKLSIPTVEAQ